MRNLSRIAFILGLSCISLAILLPNSIGDEPKAEPKVTIRVDSAKSAGKVSRYLTGACIEDVNHEIYGGIYSQMLFGESFQEPSFRQPVKGFVAYEGSWTLLGAEIHAEGGPGPKLISDHAPFSTGTVAVEIFFPDRKEGNSGLIVKTNKPGPGADNFDGYEVSLNPAARTLVLGRHRHNWEHIKDVPCEVPTNEWIRLVVKMSEQTLEVEVNGKSAITYEDREHPLKMGGFGIRQWQRAARYRDLTVQTNDKTESIPFLPNPNDTGPVSGMWRPIHKGMATAQYVLEPRKQFIGTQSQRFSILTGEGEVGIENQGLNRWGLSFIAGKVYEGYVWIRSEWQTDLFVGLESRDGARSYAQARLEVRGNEWHRLNFALTPDATDPAGRFVLKLKTRGSVVVGHAFLQPGEWGRFKGLPLRRDVVEGLIDQGLTVLRYGGSMVNAPEYRWKKMIGPRDRRPPYKGEWYPHSSNGWGIIDFLDLCEAASFLGIPAFNMDESPQDMADFVAYVNGPPESEWGKKRVADGHAAPYRLKHVELGNEEQVDEKYWERFRAIAEAVWAVDPEIVLVVGDFVYGQPITDPDNIKGTASGITNLSAHRKILDLAKRCGREVWFDIHIGTEHPGALGELAVVPTYVEALNKISNGAQHKVVIFELNSGNHAQRRALANAIAIGELQKLADKLPIVCSANCLQPDGQNDNGWDQGLLFLNPSQVWLQPPGYVARMISRSYQPINVPATVVSAGKNKEEDKLKVSAARSEDGKTLVLRVVNAGDKPIAADLSLAGFAPAKPAARVEELAGAMDARNTAAEPRRIVPATREWRHDGTMRYTFQPGSFTVMRLE
jgi:alpha-L-arabinofuranosidase